MPEHDGENIRFRLLVNGEVKGTAGLESFGVLSQTLTWVRRDPERVPGEARTIKEWVCERIRLNLGGLDSTTDEHLDWYESELHVGDEITVQILAPGEADRPSDRRYFTCGIASGPRRRRAPRWKHRAKGPEWRKGRRDRT